MAEEHGENQAEKEAMLARLAEDCEKVISFMGLADGEPQMESNMKSVSLSHQSSDRPDWGPQEASALESCAGAMETGVSSRSHAEPRASRRVIAKQDTSRFISLQD